MSRLVIGSRAELIAALRAQEAPLAAGEAAARAAAAAEVAAARAAFDAQVAAMRRALDARVAALREKAEADAAPLAARRAPIAERRRAVAEELFLDALFIVAQFPGGQIAEADKCCYAFDVRLCAGLCRATWAEEAFWSGLVRVHTGRRKVTRLMCAAAHRRPTRVRWLLARGAPKEAKCAGGWTALHYACWNGGTTAPSFYGWDFGGDTAISVLLAAGASADAVSNKGETPLFLAARRGRHGAVFALLKVGRSHGARRYDGRAPRMIPLRREALATANTSNNEGATPLFVAAQEGHTDTVRLLIDAGVNFYAAKNDGTSPLFIAAQKGHTDVVRALLAARAHVEGARGDGHRPLHAASASGQVAAATLLLDAGAAVNALTNDGRSPLALAATPAMRALLAARGGV